MHRYTWVQAGFFIVFVGTGLPCELKAQPFKSAAHLLTRKIARQLHAGWATSTGSFTKWRRIDHRSPSSPSSNRHRTRSRIMAINSSSVSPCVAISGLWHTATNMSSSCSTWKASSFFINVVCSEIPTLARHEQLLQLLHKRRSVFVENILPYCNIFRFSRVQRGMTASPQQKGFQFP